MPAERIKTELGTLGYRLGRRLGGDTGHPRPQGDGSYAGAALLPEQAEGLSDSAADPIQRKLRLLAQADHRQPGSRQPTQAVDQSNLVKLTLNLALLNKPQDGPTQGTVYTGDIAAKVLRPFKQAYHDSAGLNLSNIARDNLNLQLKPP